MDWVRGLRDWARRGDRSLWNLLWNCSVRRPAEKFAGRRVPTLPAWLAPEVRQAAALGALRRSGRNPVYSSAARELQFSLCSRIGKVLRFNGLPWEERHPLLYRPLVEFMLAIPWEQKVLPSQDRVLQRRAFTGVLPEIIRLRTDKAEGKSLLINGMREHWATVKETLDQSRLAELELVDLPLLRAACERVRHGLLNRHFGFFMAALSLDVWLRWQQSGRFGHARLVPEMSATRAAVGSA
jgi:hypothetical protein